MSGRAWTRRDVVLLRKLYPDTHCVLLERRLQRSMGAIYQKVAKLGLHRSAKFVRAKKELERRNLLAYGAAHRFRKGQTPQNKGIRRPGWFTGRMRDGWFKKGERSGVSALKWKPVGSIGSSEGYLYVKIAEATRPPYGFPNKQSWRLLHHKVWEDAGNPPVNSRTHCLIFKDGNRKNCALPNLELITRAENARRNSIHKLPLPLKRVIYAKIALKRKITLIERKNHDATERRNAVSTEERAV